MSRWPAIFMLFAHGALFLLRTPMVALLPGRRRDSMFGSVWLTVLSFEALLFTISDRLHPAGDGEGAHGTASPHGRHGRSAHRHRQSPLVPAGRGLLAKRHIANPRPTAVLLIDLDHFKSINDRFGHALGDRVLEIFTEAARKSMRGSDLFGRLGGEEFAAVLCDTSRDKAVAVAERIRESFAQATQEVDGRPVCATVSIGLVHCQEAALDMPALLAQADQGLITPRSAAATGSRSHRSI